MLIMEIVFVAALIAITVFGLVQARIHRYTERQLRNNIVMAAVILCTAGAWCFGKGGAGLAEQGFIFFFLGLIAYALAVSQPDEKL